MAKAISCVRTEQVFIHILNVTSITLATLANRLTSGNAGMIYSSTLYTTVAIGLIKLTAVTELAQEETLTVFSFTQFFLNEFVIYSKIVY